MNKTSRSRNRRSRRKPSRSRKRKASRRKASKSRKTKASKSKRRSSKSRRRTSKSRRKASPSKVTIVMKRSNKSDKKYMVIITDNKGKKKTVHFGAKGYSDYTKHKDAERKGRYITRHKAKENWSKSGINKPGFWSRWILWNKPGLKTSIKDTERRFKIKIKN